MLYRTRVAMDITNSDIRIISFKGDKVQKWMSSPIPAGMIRDGVIQEPEAMAVQVDALFRTLGLDRQRILCTITGLPFIYRTITMPSTDYKVKVEAIERAARLEMSVAEDDMYLVWQLIGNRQNQNESEYFVVGVPRKALNPFLQTLSGAGIRASRIDVKPLALARAVSYTEALIISLEKEYFDIILVHEGMIRVIHSFGNAVISSDIFGLVNEIAGGLNIAVKSFNRDYPQNEFPADTPVLISGELASDSSLLTLVQETTGHPVSLIDTVVPVPYGLPPELYAASLGLSLYQKEPVYQRNRYYDIGVNLLEGLKKRKTKTVNAGIVFAISAAIILLVVLFRINALRAEATRDVKTLENRVTAEAQQLSEAQEMTREAEESKNARLEQYRLMDNELKELQGKNRTIKDLKADFASSVALVMECMPDGMCFVSVSLQKSAITVTGQTPDIMDVMIFCEEMEKKNKSIMARVVGIDPLEEGGVSFQVAVVERES
ncbi:MAG: pilus assembly protein PilM [Dehalococcoidales bacterium]|nr:pilus assembly protein PilM [Dehalococcoidales bacterium]